MMPMIELPEGKACLILFLADKFPEGEAAKNLRLLSYGGLQPHWSRWAIRLMNGRTALSRLGGPVSWTHRSSSDNITSHIFWK
jgi:hypothetical protein